MKFKLQSDFNPTGDQPIAIKELVTGLKKDIKYQTLLGVTGSGKTFTMANVIKEVNRPTLVLSHNKTLAAQLFSELKHFFPNNAVEYFVSYYDYYQPEAYIPSSGTYIEKDLSINEEIEKYRLKTTSTLLSGREDVIVVSSVSCIYGIGNPKPKFILKGCFIKYPKVVGDKHYSFFIEDSYGNRIKAISFNSLGTELGNIIETTSFTKVLVVTLIMNRWAGEENIEILLEDIII